MSRLGAGARLAVVFVVAVSLACAGPPGVGGESADGPSVAAGDASSEDRHVFYLHGRIIELHGRRPEHPQFGIYEYDEILAALGAEGARVVSEVRPEDTDAREYARRIAGEVEQLIASGVSPERITVVGFSKGGAIALGVSALVAHEEVRYVFLAACSPGAQAWLEGELRGRALSIREASDPLGPSCAPLFERSTDGLATAEITLETGLGHGAFYLPRDEWLHPTLDWIAGRSVAGSSSGRAPG